MIESLEREYTAVIRRKKGYIGFLLALIVISAIGFAAARMDVPFWQPIKSIYQYAMGTLPQAADRDSSAIILMLRLPRVLLAILSGFALAIAGTVMQSITRNYLVSPFTVGIAAAAAFGASFCIILGIGDISYVIAAAFLTAVLSLVLLYGIANRVGISPGSIILVGIALNYLFSALSETVRFFAKSYQLEQIVQWSFGTLSRADWEAVIILWFVVMIGAFLISAFSRELDILAHNSDDVTRSLGVNCRYVRLCTGVIAVLMTATVICFTGVIGFIGLIAPHITRMIVGGEHAFSLWFSGALGALLMLVADGIGHYLLPPNDIPVAIILSFVGVPLFIHLILKMRRIE